MNRRPVGWTATCTSVSGASAIYLHTCMHNAPLYRNLPCQPPSTRQISTNASASASLLLIRLLAIKVLSKLPLDSTRAALFLSERIHHPHILLIAPCNFIIVVVKIVLLVIRAATSAVAVRRAFAIEFVVAGEFVRGVVGAVVVFGWSGVLVLWYSGLEFEVVLGC